MTGGVYDGVLELISGGCGGPSDKKAWEPLVEITGGGNPHAIRYRIRPTH